MGIAISESDVRRNLRAFQSTPRENALLAVLGIPDSNTNTAGTSPASTIIPAEYGNDATIRKTVLTITALTIALSDDAGVAQYGGAKIYDLPTGLIQIVGATVVGNFTGYASLIDTFASNVALGTVTATTGATLVSTEADIMASVANATAAAEVAAVDAGSTTAAVIQDGRGTAKDVYLNFVVADDAAHGTGNASFTGTVTLYWRNLTAL
jgi:hypothetical protein